MSTVKRLESTGSAGSGTYKETRPTRIPNSTNLPAMQQIFLLACLIASAIALPLAPRDANPPALQPRQITLPPITFIPLNTAILQDPATLVQNITPMQTRPAGPLNTAIRQDPATMVQNITPMQTRPAGPLNTVVSAGVGQVVDVTQILGPGPIAMPSGPLNSAASIGVQPIPFTIRPSALPNPGSGGPINSSAPQATPTLSPEMLKAVVLALLACVAGGAHASVDGAQQQKVLVFKDADASAGSVAGVKGLDTAAGVSASLVAAGIDVVRGITFDDKASDTVSLHVQGDLIALSRGASSILALWKDASSQTGWSHRVIVDGTDLGLTHSVILHDGMVYASSVDNVYRWPYVAGSRQSIRASDAEVVVRNINGEWNGHKGHDTRTLLVGDGYLYVSIGSRSNIDNDSRAAMIRRFKLEDVPKDGFLFAGGKIWAEGTRNNVAMAFDEKGRLWGAENGADNLSRNDLHRIPKLHGLSSDYHQDSPVEEVNIFDDPTAFYGYPYCFTAGNVTTTFETDAVRGSQWAWPNFMKDGVHSDDWCRLPNNNRAPALHIPAHSAPIAMEFFARKAVCGKKGAMPCRYKGNLFVTLHGSWNRDIPSGYSVIMFETGSTGKLVQKIKTLAHATDFQNKCKGRLSYNCFRPAGLAISPWGTLFVSSDTTGEIVELTFDK
ncbi:hypothetical protein HDU96_005528 [Phlyctochytrium bullatum]|nr:hypothetical protein HDU96_005528 [Phlyctochytrium bullatum]